MAFHEMSVANEILSLGDKQDRVVQVDFSRIEGSPEVESVTLLLIDFLKLSPSDKEYEKRGRKVHNALSRLPIVVERIVWSKAMGRLRELKEEQ